MNFTKIRIGFFFFACFLLASVTGFSQITSTAIVIPTEYSSGQQDAIHVFCGEKDQLNASLIASYPNGETGNFEWQKYNPVTGSFVFFSSDLSGNQTSSISNLIEGCYRVKITTTSGPKTYTAWVFNNSYAASAEIIGSDCNSFTLKGTLRAPTPTILQYVDLANGQPKVIDKEIKLKWKDGATVVNSNSDTFQNFAPPTKNTNYTFEVTDRFGCVGQADVTYISIVTIASFEYKLKDQGKKSDPTKVEAPATYTFTNTSENGDAGQYEWYFYKDVQQIKDEKALTFKDSIQDIIYSDSPVYTYEKSGEYKVKLVSKNASCSDITTIDKNIIILESFIDAPNVFTPNGDLKNDNFAVLFFSMKTVKFTIVNRWGKVLHVWESNNVQGFYNTAETIPQSVWDGKVGGKYASPGVYFWVAEGIGRDGKKRTGNGFFHLFR